MIFYLNAEKFVDVKKIKEGHNLDVKLIYKRCLILVSLILIVIAAYVYKLVQFQIVDHEKYADSALSYTASSIKVTAARGEILDRYGRTIATNRMGYAIIFQASEFNAMDNAQRNEVIYRLTKIIDENEGRNEDGSQKWEDSCPLLVDSYGNVSFAENSSSAISSMETMLELQSYATAQNCFDEMTERYETEGLAPEVARTIMGVRLEMELCGFNSSTPFTFAGDVSQDTMQIISENSTFFRGVTVEIVPIREYTEGTLAPHLIGITGKIYAEEYEELSNQGYGYNDVVGKFGVEKAYESYLRGTNGIKKVEYDSDGNVIYTEYTREPKAGNTVVLTIDSDLQRTAQESIENVIKSQAAAGIEGSGADANAGAVVVMNVKTFEVLAAVTYPSFDLNTYLTDYNSLSKDENTPLFNRALNGGYAPGSTFKPAIALAGLQEYENNKDEANPSLYGIDRNEKITCEGFIVFEDLAGWKFKCDAVHGAVNVTEAIAQSCNIFFYTVANRVGIDKMNEYCKQMGLGSKTGVGLGESSGTLAGREERQSRNLLWYTADTMQAAIGQSDNRFTPMQICTYISTLANGGTRYSATLIKTIKSYDMFDTIQGDAENNKTILAQLEASQTMLDIVKEGMLGVTEEGTASTTFENYQIKIGGKTGTADTNQSSGDEQTESPNAIFVAFAPYEDPEIAVAVIGEKCGHGKVMAQVARDIFDEYFFSSKTSGYDILEEGGISTWSDIKS